MVAGGGGIPSKTLWPGSLLLGELQMSIANALLRTINVQCRFTTCCDTISTRSECRWVRQLDGKEMASA